MELELRHLRVVCRVADTGSVSKAAAALGVSQPSLTAQLQRIEEAIGGPLFERGPYGVQATPLGRHVLGRARAMLADMDDLVGSTRRYTSGTAPLRLGSVRTVMFGAWLSRLEEVLRGREFTTQVDASTAVINELLAADVLDLAMLGRCEEHAPACPPGVREQTMVSPEPFAIALPAEHRLADADEVKLAELSQDVWICPPAGKADGDLAYLREVCETVGGFTPDFRYANLDTTEIEQLIGAGRGISLCLPTVREIPQTVIKPLAGQPLTWRRVLRWRVDHVPQEIVDVVHQAFVDVYRRTLHDNASVRPWWAANPEAHPTVLDPGQS